MKKKTRTILKAVIFSLCLIIFIVVSRLLLIDKIESFDKIIYNFIIGFKSKPLTIFFKCITTLCSMWFVALSTILIMLFSKDKKKAFYIALNVLLCFILNQFFKFIFTRERPLGINIIQANGYSFPSGHSMLSVAFYGFLAYLSLHSKKSKRIRIFIILGFILLTLLIGISRIYLGVHFASDVLAGFALALAYLILFVTLIYDEKKRI